MDKAMINTQTKHSVSSGGGKRNIQQDKGLGRGKEVSLQIECPEKVSFRR
jgi:hypothetical protein